MNGRKTPLFVQRRTYRRRRMADAARVLPVAGAILFFIPLLWRGGETGARTSFVMVYLFLIWVVLIVCAGILSRFLRPDETDDPSDANGDGVS